MENESNVDVIFASDLGWRPGEWPLHWHYNGIRYTRDRTVRLLRGDFAGYRYVNCDHGGYAEITVYND